MALPGKLCIGILEEDNPLRSYFRFKPLLVEQDGRYVPFEGADQYPDEGCIRIVPDKNESYYFKARMRQNGLFCVVDLREHPGDCDKIRPNKNYRPGGDEINGSIIYSDVVRAPVANMIYQVLPAESAGAMVPQPHTPRVLLRQAEGLMPGCRSWDAVEIAGNMALLNDPDLTVDLPELQVFDLPGFRGETVSFAIVPAGKLEAVAEPIERPGRRGEERHVEPKAEKPEAVKSAEAKAEKPPEPKPAEAKPVEPKSVEAKPVEAKPIEAKPAEPKAIEAKPAEAKPVEAKPAEPKPVETRAEEPKPVEPAPAETKPVRQEPKPPMPEAAAEAQPQTAPAPEGEKPWIHRDASMLPRPVDKRLSRSQQLMAAQAGLNPRRGRSLQELIDEKWAQSRMTQLGMPVSPIATGAPVRNPVDEAVSAIRRVWENPAMREQLMNSLSQAEEIDAAFHARRDAVLKSSINSELNDLEAQRLQLLTELEHLKTGSQSMRARLKQEILKDEARAFEDAAGKTRAARAEQAKYEKQAEDARAAAKDAQALLDALAGKELERKIMDVALTQRVTERLALMKDAAEGPVAPPETEAADLPALVSRLSARMAAEGWQVSDFEAANLCVCLAISPVLLLSGAPGSGKTRTAQLLADALGASASGRMAACPAGKRPLREEVCIKTLLRAPDAPTVLLLDDANLSPAADPLRGMGTLPGPEWRLIATVQDSHSGAPLSAATLDRGFMVRLAVPDNLPWRPAETRPLGDEAPVSLAALAGSLPQGEVPQAVESRMALLRRSMAEYGAPVSRRALNESWRYCSAMLGLLGEEADALSVFDHALAQRVLPALIAAAPAGALAALKDQVADLPRCAGLLRQPAPIMV